MQLPHFPLHSVVFPHLPLPLHVFEERYRAMAADLTATDSPWQGRFVVSMITDGPEVGGEARSHAIGTICEVHTAERFADGRWMLLAVGVARARIGVVHRSGPYAVAELDELAELVGEGAAELVPSVQRALDAYLATVKRFVVRTASVAQESQDSQVSQETGDVTTSLDHMLKPIRLPDDPSAASYAVGGMLQVELSRKQHLLELPDAATRLRAELELLRRETRLLDDGAMPPVPTSDLGYHPN
ncbi:MAG TPA: LON peptidase substrate-binding domain-containing protein [Methylomirabilota bacterium]|nr:LON peptidase substrate-binding domain-containing protein [Methylomirabilota bacterium]